VSVGDLIEELRECTTARTRWWAIKIDGYFYYGEVIDRDAGVPGFGFDLFETKEGAEERIREIFETDIERIPYEIVEICWTECK